MPRMTLRFGELASESVERAAASLGKSVEQLVVLGCVHYLDELAIDPDRPALLVPSFAARQVQASQSVEARLLPQVAQRLQLEASRQGIERDVLAHHATLLFIADLDLGRVAVKIAERSDEI